MRWELAIVQAFGATFPQPDAERAASLLGPELLEALAEARRDGDAGGLEAVAALLRIYEVRLGGLLPKLRAALRASPLVEELLLERPPDRPAGRTSCGSRSDVLRVSRPDEGPLGSSGPDDDDDEEEEDSCRRWLGLGLGLGLTLTLTLG